MKEMIPSSPQRCHGAKCFSADLIVYDIICDRWHNVQDSVPKDLNADMARFGHSAVLRNGTMLVHAGFQVHTSFVLLISKNKMEIDDSLLNRSWNRIVDKLGCRVFRAC